MLTTTAVYMRVSTDKQAEKNGVEFQQERIHNWLRSQGIDPQDVEHFIDEGVSGGTDKRPEFQRMMKLVKKGEIGKVVFYDLSRFMRNLEQQIKYLKVFREAGVDVAFVVGGFDSSTAIGRLALNLHGAIVEYQRERASEMASEWMQARMDDGYDPAEFTRKISQDASLEIAKELMDLEEKQQSITEGVRGLADRLEVSESTIWRAFRRGKKALRGDGESG